MSTDSSSRTCPTCQKIFSRVSNLRKHINNVHELKRNDETFTCNGCSKIFSKKFNLVRHLPTCNQQKQTKRRKCSLCDYQNEKCEVLKHYGQAHDVDISEEKIVFKKFSEFETWKETIEKRDVSKYIRYHSRRSNEKTAYYYRCHRDGYFTSSGKNLRHLKVAGSNKINGYCPSEIDLTILNETGQVTAKFLKSHVGHDMEAARVPLSKADREFLAEQISRNVPFDQILDSLKNNFGGSHLERLHFVTKKDLFNIRDLNGGRHVRPSDYKSIEEWVMKMKDIYGEKFVRFYKKQDTIDEAFGLRPNDFLLIIMNDAQLEFLKKYGKNGICLDYINDFTFCDLRLMSLTVLDHLKQSFPCLFALTNKSDGLNVLKTVFRILKNALDETIKPAFFMSDVTETPYNAWCNVIGPVDSRLYNAWHLDKTWRESLRRNVENSQKREGVYKNLRSLLEEQDPVDFVKALAEMTASLRSDIETEKFAKHFEDRFVDCAKSWAYCYRVDFGLNVNSTQLEKLHKALACICLKRNVTNRLDKVIEAIMKSIRDKLETFVVIDKGKVSTQLIDLLQRHRDMQELNGNITVTEGDGTFWKVSASENPSDSHRVERNRTDCNCVLICFLCETCVHAYTCSCPDSIIQWRMCKHIHLVCQHLLEASPNQNLNTELEVFDNQYENEWGDSHTVLMQLDLATTDASPDDLDRRKTSLLQNFQEILNSVKNVEECDLIEKALLSLRSAATQNERNDRSPTEKGPF